MQPFWTNVNEAHLRQGDFLPHCLVPIFHSEFGADSGEIENVPVDEYDLIIVTQSCDLENKRARLVVLSPIYSVNDFEEINENFKRKGG